MIAGGIAGLVVEAALYPIDTIKTRVQVMFLLKSIRIYGSNISFIMFLFTYMEKPMFDLPQLSSLDFDMFR